VAPRPAPVGRGQIPHLTGWARSWPLRGPAQGLPAANSRVCLRPQGAAAGTTADRRNVVGHQHVGRLQSRLLKRSKGPWRQADPRLTAPAIPLNGLGVIGSGKAAKKETWLSTARWGTSKQTRLPLDASDAGL